MINLVRTTALLVMIGALAACGATAPAASSAAATTAAATAASESSATAGAEPASASAQATEPASAQAEATEAASAQAEASTQASAIAAASASGATQASAAPAASAPSATAGTTKLNINTATPEEFTAAIPDLGNRMVREFLEYRPYVSIQQFRQEIGKYVDDTQVAEYEQYIYVPIDIDEADAATLQQLPGVDQAIADVLIAARPFDSADAFLTQLGTLVSEADVAAASSFLAGE